MAATKPIEPLTFLFADDGSMPNNPKLPLLIYRGAIALPDSRQEAAIEKIFQRNGWGDMWRDGIFPYVHYHSSIHEGMGIAQGRATVRFGGDRGREIDVMAGDVAVLPAGTGHHCLWASPDLKVVGAYPKTGRYDLCRGSEAEYAKAVVSVAQVPLPETDPVYGAEGPLRKLWAR